MILALEWKQKFPQLGQKKEEELFAKDSSVNYSLGYSFYDITNIYYDQEMQRQKSTSNNYMPQTPLRTKPNWSRLP